MRPATAILLLWSCTGFPGALAQETDSQVAASWTTSGTCAYYFRAPGKHTILSDTCSKYCETHGGHGYSECDHSLWKDLDIENKFSSLIDKDDGGNVFVVTKCKCSNPTVEAITTSIFEVVAQGLSQLDNLLCAIMLETFKIILDVGIMFVPGGAPANAAIKAVQGAKSFVENGLEAADYFGNWVGKACGMPDWNFDLWGALIGAPDSISTSIGCKKKNKADCKKMDPIPDPPKKVDPPKLTKLPEPTKVEPTKLTKQPEPTKVVPTVTKNDDSKKSMTTITSKHSSSTSTTSSTSRSSSSSSSDCGAATGTKAAAACEATTPCIYKERDVDVADTLLPRRGLGSPLRRMLEKRGKKSGNPCAITHKTFSLDSDEYPSWGKLDDNVDSYGWKTQKSYCDYDWQNGTKKIAGAAYESEHVMEWQIVTDFFAKMQEKGGLKYTHPNPLQANKMVDFCTYWIESWTLEPQQAFSIGTGPALSPWKHIAAAYPSTKNNKAEMIALQDDINAPAKANLFTDRTKMIWTETTMDKWAKTKAKRLTVLGRLRLAIGARKYLTETKVKTIFKAQKERMGKILDELDTAMSAHPRQEVNALTGVTTKFQAWKKQNLLTEWNTFMDEKWANAVAKHKKVMDKWVNALDDNHCQSQTKKTQDDKEFCERLRKLQKEYAAGPAFSKPW
ncbi:hypothetical protein CC86DRAFT_373485 [Ophiobolus disseminans]|uniref:Uncharacterized protein n=1 Tax=Ophiobolus disseminans TaxID=1469910 RepID=A0A6A6ZL38_9PLEO|nr:hypothetical protein CC86DRAFT_373485 [Ophiobolus disseminans]